VSLGISRERKSLMIILFWGDGEKTIPVANGKELCLKIEKNMFGIMVNVEKNGNVHCSVIMRVYCFHCSLL
jgi:hypothetical protein